MILKVCLLLLSFQVAALSESKEVVNPNKSEVVTVAADGIKVHGQKYFDTLDDKTPLILLFHQAGSNGRGEYADLIPWLNASGYRAMAWDQRSGGDRFGSVNRTVNGLSQEVKYSYCEVSLDLQAALDYVTEMKLADKVVVWGSSYSAALVFKLAADNKQTVSGVASFSPASGGPMSECRAKLWLDQITVPMVVFRPETEMTRESSLEQRDLFKAAGVSFNVIANGVHGSSMLVDARTEHDMTEARKIMKKWLKGH